ncbi:hypothetical protein IWQ62_001631 [Dispira parvispora]|uniref:FHF complex subunit HOOK-interacting protein C-terminal domain-containing protein n=1 Tax=Dispira parvispora TaxID=1520584 RepID=A0A9W8E7Z5_9FUNG|nr:hypothetical protein IWQ62_001631 [Dispira parvispora]
MDYFARLTKRIARPKKAKPTPGMRLEKFEKAWKYCHNTYFLQDRKVDAKVSHTGIPQNLKVMVDLLVEEELETDMDDSSTGVCLEYFLRNNVLAALVHLSEADCPAGLLGETIRTMANLVNLLDDRFLVHKGVHTPLLNLLRMVAANPRQSIRYQEDLVDLAYLLCSKIHGFPELLHIFFLDRSWLHLSEDVKIGQSASHVNKLYHPTSVDGMTDGEPSQSTECEPGENTSTGTSGLPVAQVSAGSPQGAAAAPKEFEFLLFTYLLQFIHKEGKVGDYARTGLLFLVELSHDSDLCQFILRSSDLSTILSASMGALYSQLPRRLMVAYDENLLAPTKTEDSHGSSYPNVPAVATTAGMFAAASADITGNTQASPDFTTLAGRASLGEHDDTTLDTSMDAMESTTSPEFHQVMVSFLKLVEFYQDVLDRCPNPTLHRSLLYHFQTHFLETVLYPSLLESSDADGTAVAVMTYLELILQTLGPSSLTESLMFFLLGSDHILDDSLVTYTLSNDANVEGQQTTLEPKSHPTTLAFNLKDLICTNLQSDSRFAIIAALKLWTTILTDHCKYTPLLLDTLPCAQRVVRPPRRSTGGLVTHDNVEGIPQTPIQQHLRDMESYVCLLSLIDGEHISPTFITGYERYLSDVEAAWERHAQYHYSVDQQARTLSSGADPSSMCALPAQSPQPGWPTSGSTRSRKYSRQNLLHVKEEDAGDQEEVADNSSPAEAPQPCSTQRYRLSPNDPLLRALLHLMAKFYSHSVDVNLALTGTIAALASCPHRELEGLFVQDPPVAQPLPGSTLSHLEREKLLPNQCSLNKKALGVNTPSAGDDVFNPWAGVGGKTPLSSPRLSTLGGREAQLTTYTTNPDTLTPMMPWQCPGHSSYPSFLVVFHTLAQQVGEFRTKFSDFDHRLLRTRTSLLLTPCPQIQPVDAQSASPCPARYVSSTESTTSALVSHSSERALSDSRSSTGKPPEMANVPTPGTVDTAPSNPPQDTLSSAKISFASLCENVLILEEFVKELVAVVQVRRSTGQDMISYVS